MCAGWKEHTREVLDCVFCTLCMVDLLRPAGITKTATSKARNDHKTLGRLGLDCDKILGHKYSFPNKHFLDYDRYI